MGCTGRRKAKQKKQKISAPAPTFTVYKMLCFEPLQSITNTVKEEATISDMLVAVQRLDELAQIRLVDVPAANI